MHPVLPSGTPDLQTDGNAFWSLSESGVRNYGIPGIRNRLISGLSQLAPFLALIRSQTGPNNGPHSGPHSVPPSGEWLVPFKGVGGNGGNTIPSMPIP